jgi:hypothetical protein
MAFIADITFVLELLAFSAGTGLLYLASKEGIKRQLGIKLAAYFIMLASVATMVCTGFSAYRARQFWQKYEAEMVKASTQTEKSPESAPQAPETSMCKCGMMGKEGGMKCPMMEKMMKTKEATESMPSGEDMKDAPSSHH